MAAGMAGSTARVAVVPSTASSCADSAPSTAVSSASSLPVSRPRVIGAAVMGTTSAIGVAAPSEGTTTTLDAVRVPAVTSTG